MNSKRLAAAAAGLSLLWGAAAVAQEQMPRGPGAAANDFVILELVPGQGQPSAEEMLMMQMLLLQLLMQSETQGGETQNVVPNAPAGVVI